MKPETIRRLFKHMPVLDHFPKRNTGEPFCWEESEVVQWLANNPESQRKLFEAARRCGAIAFDPLTRTWKGAATRESGLIKRRQNTSSSEPSNMTTPPSSKYQHPSYRGGAGYVCDDRRTPTPLPRDEVDDFDDDLGEEVLS